MYEGEGRSRLDSETRSAIMNPGVSIDDQSNFMQKDSFDQTGIDMISRLKEKMSERKDWSKDGRLSEFFK